MKVLITGACGVTSRAVARSIRLSKRFHPLEIIGIDNEPVPYGLFEGLFDRIYRSPYVDDSFYEEWIRKFVADELPDAAIVNPELEVLFWSSKGFPVSAILPPCDFCHIAISKRRLYESLSQTGLVPPFSIINSDLMINRRVLHIDKWPVWIRDITEGSSSGRGSILAKNSGEACAWALLNPEIQQFMFSEYLPGRNFACTLLYSKGELKRIACYERLEYFMSRVVMSGVSGNITRGRLVNDKRLVNVSKDAIDILVKQTGELMDGLVAVDLKEDIEGHLYITEINLRNVAANYAFALAGFNIITDFRRAITAIWG